MKDGLMMVNFHFHAGARSKNGRLCLGDGDMAELEVAAIVTALQASVTWA
jgi:hypothetical protein